MSNDYTNNGDAPTLLNEKEIIPAIAEASSQYYKSKWDSYLALQSLYLAYVSASQSSLVHDRVKAEYKQRKGPRTDLLSNMVAYLGMFKADEAKYIKQRVSDVHILITAAQANKISPSSFAQWIKDAGGTTAIVRAQRKQQQGNKSNTAKTLYAAVTKMLNLGKARKLTPVGTPPVAIGTDEYAVQIVRRKADGTYQACWAQISSSKLDFPELSSAQLKAVPKSKSDLLSSATLGTTA